MIQFVYKWQTLIAVLVSGAITLFAAFIAWRAVQRQIANQRTIASRNEDDAFTAIQEGGAELYGMLNLVWRAVDVALSDQRGEHGGKNFALVRVLRDVLPNEKSLDALVEIAQQLGPSKRRRFLLFINLVRSLYRHYLGSDDRLNEMGTTTAELEERRKFYLINLRIYLTHAFKYLENFDAEASTIFADRQKANVDHRHTHEHLEGLIASAEQGEQNRTA